MVLLCWWNFQVIPILLWEDHYLALEALAWIFGWKITTLSLGCNVLSYVIPRISLIINTNLFP